MREWVESRRCERLSREGGLESWGSERLGSERKGGVRVRKE